MKAVALFLLAMTLAASSPAADPPTPDFPKVGETYRIQTASPLVETPYENRVTVLSVGEHQWAKVQYEKAKLTRDGGGAKQVMEKLEMWVNFAHVTSAVKAVSK